MRSIPLCNGVHDYHHIYIFHQVACVFFHVMSMRLKRRGIMIIDQIFFQNWLPFFLYTYFCKKTAENKIKRKQKQEQNIESVVARGI